jgi:hypothetical protein
LKWLALSPGVTGKRPNERGSAPPFNPKMRWFMMRNIGRTATCALVLLAATASAKAQGTAQGITSGGNEGPDGFQLYSVSVYAEYSSEAVPFGLTGGFSSSLPFGANLGPNYFAGIVAKVGYRKMGARTNFYVTYVPSYDASLRYSSLNSMNNSLSIGLMHNFSPRWTLTSSATALTARYDQFLFSPTVFSSLAGTPATFDELSQAILSGTYTNSELASILTGAPLIESPASNLIYGPRIFTASLRNTISYEHSTRLRFHFGFGGSRTQGLNSGQIENASVRLLPETTTATAAAGVDYTLSPVTDVSFEASGYRTFSRFEDAYISNGTASVGRILGRHWIARVRGGAGVVTPIRQTFATPPGLHYLAGATVTYKTVSHTFMGSYDRTITDYYGLGAHSAGVASGAWNWHIPGRTWFASAVGRYEMLEDIDNHNLDSWLGNAGIGRRFGMHTILRLAYLYGRIEGAYGNAPEKQSLQGVQLMVSWSPHLPLGM